MNTQIVYAIQEAIRRGDLMELMAHVARDIRWAVNTNDRRAAPWFGEYRGRKGVLAFFEALSQVDVVEFTIKAVVGEGDLVAAWLHVEYQVPSGSDVKMDEVQFWRLRDGKVESVDLFPDTLAIFRGFDVVSQERSDQGRAL